MTKQGTNSYPFLFLVILLLVARFFYLDQDVPGYMISGICQEDEGAYCTEAIIKAKVSEGQFAKGYETAQNREFIMAFTPFTYAGLYVLGLNYYGLRISVVIFSVIMILLIWDLFRKMKTNLPEWVKRLFLLFLLTDFYFLLFSRFQTPQIYSLFIITVVIWAYLKAGYDTAKGALLLGFGGAIAMLVVYVYNAFFLAAGGSFILVLCILTKKYSLLKNYLIGFICGFAFYLACLYLMDTNINKVISSMMEHGGGVQVQDSQSAEKNSGTGITNFINAFLQIISTNFFRYNLSLLFVFILSIPLAFYAVIKYRDRLSIFFLLCFFFIYLQSVFVVSYPFKKLIVLFPLVVIFIYYHIKYCVEIKEIIVKNKKIRVITLLCGLAALSACVYNNKVNNDPIYWSGFDYGYYVNIPASLNLLNICALAFIFILFSAWILSWGKNLHAKYLLHLLIVPGVTLSIFYFFWEKKYDVSDALKSMEIHVSRKNMAGDIYTYTLYNSARPMLDHYASNRYETQADSLFNIGLPDHRVIKYFKHNKKFQNYKEADIYKEYVNCNLRVKKIYVLTYYNYMLLEKVDKAENSY